MGTVREYFTKGCTDADIDIGPAVEFMMITYEGNLDQDIDSLSTEEREAIDQHLADAISVIRNTIQKTSKES